MAIKKEHITHRSECIPGLIRSEVYEYKDIVYTEQHDDETGKMNYGHVTMYNGIHVCTVYVDGSIKLTMPTDLAIDHKGMMDLIADVQRLDEFLSVVVENYH
jgi:hypothetical protein